MCTAVPILVYGCWAATPGTHAIPFEWSMTVPIWGGWLAMTISIWRISHCHSAGPMVSVAATAVGGVGACDRSRGVTCRCVRGSLWPCLIVLVVDVWLIAMILFAVQTRTTPDLQPRPYHGPPAEETVWSPWRWQSCWSIGAGLVVPGFVCGWSMSVV